LSDTICALATPPGIGGLSVIRVSGESAFEISDICFRGRKKLAEVESHTIHYGSIYDGETLIDKVTASVFIEPASYTGENTVEISSHGGMLVAGEILRMLQKFGARMAEPGEFTKRAFLNGKMDLTQVEAVADIIHAQSVQGSHTAARQLSGEFTRKLEVLRQSLMDTAGLLELELDFSDEDIQLIPKEKIEESIREVADYCSSLADSYHSAEILRSGYFVSIAGFPNSGKSTLFNALLQRERAIVSDIEGTTRDFLEESLMINDISIRLTDTAGLRDSTDTIEIEGIRFAEKVLEQSDMIMILNDITKGVNNSSQLMESLKRKYPAANFVLLQNKTDLVESTSDIAIQEPGLFYISAKKRIGIEPLEEFLYSAAKESTSRISDLLVNQRHAILLRNTNSSLLKAIEALKYGLENEVIAIDIRDAIKYLGELTGKIWSEDILNNIFSRFCIGK
jgi:tRNA modification GTPase